MEASIPYCTRFKMQVGYFDSCKYYNDEEMMELIGIMAKSMQKQKEAISSSRRKKRSKQYLITIIFIICILVFIWIKFK